MALGAQRSSILALILGEGLVLTGAGLLAGMALTAAATQAMKNLLFGVDGTEPAVLVSIALLLVGVAALACYIPARRAVRLDPIAALRNE
jgi:putative ABC transport system permease protein